MALPWMESINVWGDESKGAEKSSQAPTRMAILFAVADFTASNGLPRVIDGFVYAGTAVMAITYSIVLPTEQLNEAGQVVGPPPIRTTGRRGDRHDPLGCRGPASRVPRLERQAQAQAEGQA